MGKSKSQTFLFIILFAYYCSLTIRHFAHLGPYSAIFLSYFSAPQCFLGLKPYQATSSAENSPSLSYQLVSSYLPFTSLAKKGCHFLNVLHLYLFHFQKCFLSVIIKFFSSKSAVIMKWKCYEVSDISQRNQTDLIFCYYIIQRYIKKNSEYPRVLWNKWNFWEALSPLINIKIKYLNKNKLILIRC